MTDDALVATHRATWPSTTLMAALALKARTKNRSTVVKGLMMARSEALMILGLLMAVVIQLNFGKDQTEERLVWAVLLLIQALPYAASVLLSLFSVMPEGLRLPDLDKAFPPQSTSA